MVKVKCLLWAIELNDIFRCHNNPDVDNRTVMLTTKPHEIQNLVSFNPNARHIFTNFVCFPWFCSRGALFQFLGYFSLLIRFY